jgi:hypothetical protein
MNAESENVQTTHYFIVPALAAIRPNMVLIGAAAIVLAGIVLVLLR